MSYLLRKIKGNRWLRIPREDNNFPADPLADLNTTSNTLSVYYVEQENRDIKIAIAGIATTKPIENFGYALVKLSDVKLEGFNIIEKSGTTPSKEANQLHREIINLTAEKLVRLAKLIHRSPKKTTILKREVGNIVQDALKHKKLDKEKIKPELREKLNIDN